MSADSEPTTDGFSAWVSIDGVKLPRYGGKTTVTKGVKTVSCWIASEADKAFEVGWSVPEYPEQLMGNVYIDGTYIDGCVHILGDPKIATLSSKCVSDTVARPLIFSKTEFTDEEAYINANSDNLGEITVEIWVIQLDPRPMAVQDHEPEARPAAKIHEGTAKKAIAHRATFGEEFAIAEYMGYQSGSYKWREMTFVFKYRPREYLQAEGIIPPNPEPDARPPKRAAETPEPSTSEDEEADQNEELRLRQEELRVQKERLEVQKQEMQLQIQKEELRIQAEELRIQLDAVKVKSQRKKVKREPREPRDAPQAASRVKSETANLT
ncbi:hypothetical protein BD779DRAFT_1546476 [Infundibulicybe gibba]|nr:hypothetical protein BD779DRAFT_1546476 [Infundibulicybe gibba]